MTSPSMTPSKVWTTATLICLLVITISAFSQKSDLSTNTLKIGYSNPSATLQTAVIRGLIVNTHDYLPYLLTNGSLLVSTDKIDSTLLPDSIENVKIRVLTATQIQELADSVNYFYYLRFNKVEETGQNSARVNIGSVQAMSRLGYYQTNWEESNATMVMRKLGGEWGMKSAIIDLTSHRSGGIGVTISLAIDSAN